MKLKMKLYLLPKKQITGHKLLYLLQTLK